MTKAIYLRPEAETDIEEAAIWYEQRKPGLGDEFLDEVVQTLSFISESPLRYTKIQDNIRRALIRRFPFGVFYIQEPDQIVVIAVMHGSRNPETWKTRT